jgi:CRP-like cAMP-binding protein
VPLYAAGNPADEVILVRTGNLRLTVPHDPGGTRIVGVVGPWEISGEEGLREGVIRHYGAVAGEGTQVTYLDGPGARRGLRKPGGTRKRLGLLLKHLAERFGRIEELGARIPIRLTHQLLADLTVINRSTITTILNDWLYRRVLGEASGHLLILKAEGLV